MLLMVTFFFSLLVQYKVVFTFRKYARVPAGRGHTGAEVARRILDSHGLYNVRIERVSGSLTDHFDPRSNVLRLSESVYDNASASAAGVAAHEVGHAIQHAEGYTPIVVRGKLVPAVNFASQFSWIAIVIGVLITYVSTILGNYVIMIGILLFSATTLFHLVTLPCEFNASKRALAELELLGWYSEGELASSKKVLGSAAMTYVAALCMSVIQLLRLLSIFAKRKD